MNEHICTMLSAIELNSEHLEMIIVFGVGGVIALTAILCGSICSITRERQRQQTRREVAAYLSEGTITPDDAERILRPDVKQRG